MTAHIGIVACSAEGAALCYRTICSEAPAKMGEHKHPEITMHTIPLADYMIHVRSGDWQGVGKLMLLSVQKIAEAGANFAICPDNTIHQAMPFVRQSSPIPWLHIAEVVAVEAINRGFSRLGILGTKYLMIGSVYPEILSSSGINLEIPEEIDREKIDDIIFSELVNGIFIEKSRLYFNEVIAKLHQKGCDAVVLGCTEIPLLVDPNDCPLPSLDSTRLLSRAALARSMQE